MWKNSQRDEAIIQLQAIEQNYRLNQAENSFIEANNCFYKNSLYFSKEIDELCKTYLSRLEKYLNQVFQSDKVEENRELKDDLIPSIRTKLRNSMIEELDIN